MKFQNMAEFLFHNSGHVKRLKHLNFGSMIAFSVQLTMMTELSYSLWSACKGILRAGIFFVIILNRVGKSSFEMTCQYLNSFQKTLFRVSEDCNEAAPGGRDGRPIFSKHKIQ
jgi:hypothetical protein